jgi:hypothetical protein
MNVTVPCGDALRGALLPTFSLVVFTNYSVIGVFLDSGIRTRTISDCSVENLIFNILLESYSCWRSTVRVTARSDESVFTY